MALNKKFFPKVSAAAADTFTPSEHFNTVLYTGTGASQRIGGYINRGAVFNGSSSYITIPINKLTNTFSFSVWLYLDDLSTSYRWVFGNWNSTTQDLYVMIRDTGIIEVNPDGNNGTVAFGSSGAFSTNTWHHLVVSMDAGTYTVYLDGSSLGSGSTTNTTFNNGYNYQIGKTPNSSINEWSGKIDQFRLFDKAISSSEVTTLYGETHASTTISTTDIFDDGSGAALYQFESNVNDTGGASGKFGAGAIFNGSGNTITTSLGNSQLPVTGTWSCSCWVNWSNFTSSHVAFGMEDSSSPFYGWSLYIANTGTAYPMVNGNALTGNGQSLSANQWYHIAFTYSGSVLKFYVNNSQVGSDISTSMSAPSANFKLGDLGFYSNFYGKIDDVRLYSDVLTSTEVGYIYNNTTASIPTDNLEAYYKLDGDARDEQQLYDGTASNVTYAYDGTASNVTYQEATHFTPDLVWIQNRSSSGGYFNALMDTIRGATSIISTNSNGAATTSYTQELTSFDSNGFTLGTGGGNYVNRSGDDYVAWCWKGANSTTSYSASGSQLASNVRANTDAGFSIGTYTGNSTAGATIGHGLNSAPEIIFVKNTNVVGGSSKAWTVYAQPIGNTKYLSLSSSAGAATYNFWNNTSPTSSVFSVSSDTNVNSSSGNYVFYAFHSVNDYQKIGSYDGNGSANGTMVETGFEPAFVMIKRTDSSANWRILDNKRSTSNPRDKELYPNLTNAEGDYDAIDFLSNGFQNISTDPSYNANNGTYIYLAIAADPDTTTPTVENSFDVVTYTGNGSTSNEVETDFKPDLVWVKSRSSAGHSLVDRLRGDGTFLNSSATTGNDYHAAHLRLLDNGFDAMSNPNSNNVDYVAWCWKAGDNDQNLPQINTEGTIDSTVSVNDAAGFSIVKYTGNSGATRTVGHGLSSAPELIIVKNISDGAQHWSVYSSATGNAQVGHLNLSNAFSSSGDWGSTTPTSTVFTIGNGDARTNSNSEQHIAYCWYSVTGYSKIGSYSGNQTLNTPNQINFGFTPRFVMIKNSTNSGSQWMIFDSTRTNGYALYANSSTNEVNYSTDLLLSSQGLEFKSTNINVNQSGATYIYLAIK